MQTDRLVDALVDDLTPVQPLAPNWLRLAAWLGISLPAIALAVFVMGLRADLAERLAETSFLLQQTAMLATALTGAWAALSAGIPGTGRWRQLLPLLPLSFWFALLAGQALAEWPAQGALSAALNLDPQCIPGIALTGLIPCAAMLAMIRAGSRFNRGTAVFWGTLASAALANAGLRLFHPVDAALMVIVWQFGTVLAFTAAATLAHDRLVPRRPALS